MGGGRGYGGGGKWEIIYLSLHCHHQNDTCFKMGSDENQFNVSVESDGQSHKTMSAQTTTFLKRKESRSVKSESDRRSSLQGRVIKGKPSIGSTQSSGAA